MSVHDFFTAEVIRHAFASTAEEMSSIVQRCARSPLLRESGDHSSALTAADGGIIAQGQDLPIHLGVMSFTVREMLKQIPASELKPGDVWILNLPEVGGNHLPDVKLIKPIFFEDELVCFSVSLAHWADIGGGAPGSYFADARTIWQEGIRIPPIRIVANNQVVRDVVRLLVANVRDPADREGDILAQIAAVSVADLRIQQVLQRYGKKVFRNTIQLLIETAETQTREAIRSIPSGSYRGEDWLDDDGVGGGPVPIRVAITIDGDSATFDFSDTADSIPGPLNTTPFVTATGVIYFIKAIAEREIYHTEGVMKPIRVITRRGSVLDGGPHVPVVGGNHETSQRVVDAIVRALAAALPGRLTAGGGTTAGVLIMSGLKADGSRWMFYETHACGEGAREERDGMGAVRTHLGNMINTPSEKIEAEFPIRVLRHSLRRGSGGGGKHKGGDGLVREYLVLQDKVELTTMFERGVIPPYGLFGGADGRAFSVTLIRDGEADRPLKGVGNYVLRANDRVLVQTSGGGGYGASI